MDLNSIFWLIFLLVFFVPLIQKQFQGFSRQRKLSEIEQNRDSRVITVVHRQETMKLLGFPIMRYIDVDDAEEVLKAIKMTESQVPIDMVLHTPGGLVLPSLQIARALHYHPGKVTVFVPHFAMSGGTLIALAADEIVMSNHAVMGPVDPQINQMPAASIANAVENKPLQDLEDQTLILDDVARKATRQIRIAVQELLEDTMESTRAREIAEVLSHGTWTHDFPLHHETLAGFGLDVTTEMPTEVYELMSLYSQPTQRRGSVEYVPLPRGWEGATRTVSSTGPGSNGEA